MDSCVLVQFLMIASGRNDGLRPKDFYLSFVGMKGELLEHNDSWIVLGVDFAGVFFWIGWWLAQLVIATCIRSKTIQNSTCEITHLEWRSSKGCERLLYVWCVEVKNRATRNTNWINARKFPQQLRSAWHSPYVLIYISLLQNYLLAPQGIFVGSRNTNPEQKNWKFNPSSSAQ